MPDKREYPSFAKCLIRMFVVTHAFTSTDEHLDCVIAKEITPKDKEKNQPHQSVHIKGVKVRRAIQYEMKALIDGHPSYMNSLDHWN